MIRSLEYLVIGNPENRRVAMFQSALKRCGVAAASVLPYQELLDDDRRLSSWLVAWQKKAAASARLCIRLESPGENAEVQQQLILRGLRLAHSRQRPRYEHGLILAPQHWYAGFADLLQHVSATVAQCDSQGDQLRFTSHPDDILLAFDKRLCHAHLTKHGIAVPEALTDVANLEQLLERMRSLQWTRVFVKLATGSSASGVVALHASNRTLGNAASNTSGSTVRALTSMEMIGSGPKAKFYNNLRLRCYTRPRDVASIVNFLCKAGAHVERWLPKAALGDRSFDLRMLTIGGEPMHCVVRTSRSPITNLHLGNRRGDLEMLRQRMSRQAWSEVLQLARQAAATFPSSHMLGLDILLQPGYRRPTMLEVNAFGDLLPGVLYRRQDSYEAQVRTFRDRQSV